MITTMTFSLTALIVLPQLVDRGEEEGVMHTIQRLSAPNQCTRASSRIHPSSYRNIPTHLWSRTAHTEGSCTLSAPTRHLAAVEDSTIEKAKTWKDELHEWLL